MGRRSLLLASCLVVVACSSRASINDFDVPLSADAMATETSSDDVAVKIDAPSVDAGPTVDVPAQDITPVLDVPTIDVSADVPVVDVQPAGDVVDASTPGDAPDGSLACRSSRECSALRLVCDTVRMLCVECVSDLDCPDGQLCGADAICRAPRCTAGPSECASETRVRTCDPRTGFVEMTCPSGSACTAGRCQARACTPNAVDCSSLNERRVCNSDGSAATITTCPSAANAAGRCVATACTIVCNAGFADCNGIASDGCEVDTRNDPANCGACRMACAAGLSCTASACGCAASTTVCGGRCVDLQTNATNCGSCGNVCPTGVPCTAGSCTVDPCGGGLTSCGTRCVDTRSDVSNCGGCGLACATSGSATASVACLSSACTMTCAGSNYDVDGATTNGCELADDTLAGHTQASATVRPSQGCSDSTTSTITGGRIISDARVHSPSPTNFSATVGAAPDWYSVLATGGTLCADNYGITITTSGGSSSGTCYQVTFVTDRTTVSMTVSGSGGNTMSSGAFGLYTENTTVYLRVEKICTTAVRENVSYTLSYHL